MSVVIYDSDSHATRVAAASFEATVMSVGVEICLKYTKAAMKNGYYQTAKNLRKQGIPLDLALDILFGPYGRRG